LRLRSPAERLWRERIGSLDGRRGPTRERGGRRRAATIASWFFAEAGPPLHLFHHIADEVKSLPREPFDHSLATQPGGFFDVAPLEHERFYEFVLKRPLAASAPASRRGWGRIPSPRPACAQQALHRGGPHVLVRLLVFDQRPHAAQITARYRGQDAAEILGDGLANKIKRRFTGGGEDPHQQGG